jgi:hypothetical protein
MFPVSHSLLLAQNNPYIKEAYFDVAYSVPSRSDMR